MAVCHVKRIQQFVEVIQGGGQLHGLGVLVGWGEHCNQAIMTFCFRHSPLLLA